MTTEAADYWVPSDDALGTRLAMVRQRMGWNVKEAALACGVAPASWRGWEDDRLPRDLVAVVEHIAARTGVDDYWLLTGRKKPRPGSLGGADVRSKGFEPPTFWSVADGNVTSIDAWRRRRTVARRVAAELVSA